MSDKRLVAWGSVLSGAVFFIRIAISFFLMPFVIRILGERFYGIWLLIAAFIGYYGVFDFGMQASMLRFVSREIGADRKENVKYYVNTAFFFLSFIGLIIIIVSIITGSIAQVFIADTKDLDFFRFAIIILGISVGTGFPLRVFDGFLGAHMRFDLKRYIELAEITLRTCLTIILLKMGYGIYGLALANAFSTIFELLLKTFVSFKIDHTLSFGFRYFHLQKIREIIDYALSSFLNTINNIISNQLAPYIVLLVSNAVTVTYYGVGLTIINYFKEFFNTTQGVLFPIFSKGDGSGNIRNIEKWMFAGSRISAIMATASGVMVILYGRQFLERWLGRNFHSSYYYCIILIAPLIFSYAMLPSSNILNAINKHWQFTIIDAFRSILNIILSLILGYKIGAMGVAIGSAVPFIIFDCIVKPYYSCNSINVNPFKYWAVICWNILGVCISIIPIWLIWGRHIGADYLLLGLFFCLHSLIVVLFAYLILLSKEEQGLIASYVRGKIFEKFVARI